MSRFQIQDDIPFTDEDEGNGLILRIPKPFDPSVGPGWKSAVPSVMISEVGTFVKTGLGDSDWEQSVGINPVIVADNNLFEARFGLIIGSLKHYYVGLNQNQSSIWKVKRINRLESNQDRGWTDSTPVIATIYGQQPYGISSYGGLSVFEEVGAWVEDVLHTFALQ